MWATGSDDESSRQHIASERQISSSQSWKFWVVVWTCTPTYSRLLATPPGEKKRTCWFTSFKKTKQYWKEIWRQIEAAPPLYWTIKRDPPKSSWFKTKNNYPIYENRLLCFTSNPLCCVCICPTFWKHTKCVKSPKAKMTIECHCLLFGGKKHSVCLMTTSNHSDFNGSTLTVPSLNWAPSMKQMFIFVEIYCSVHIASSAGKNRTFWNENRADFNVFFFCFYVGLDT